MNAPLPPPSSSPPPTLAPAPTRRARLRETLLNWLPAVLRVDSRERVRAAVGAGLGVVLTAVLSQMAAPWVGQAAWLIAPVGASAVLVFALPASPLAQPWSVIGGNTLSVLVGIACVRWIPEPTLAAAIAVAAAIGLMFALRCLHPPGGSSALLAVLMHIDDPQFVLFPVLANVVLLVVAGMVYNTLTGRPYPHRQRAAPPQAARAGQPASRLTSADFDAALAHYNQVLDISRDDLENLLREAELAAWHRTLGDLRCADVMSTALVTAEFGTPLAEAWQRMRQRHIKALPVMGAGRRLAGIVTLADFMRHAQLDGHPAGLGQRLRAVLLPSGRAHSSKPEVVGQIMSTEVTTAQADQHVMTLLALFSAGEHHHIPILDSARRVVGIITQTDLVRVLSRAVRPD